MLRLFSWGIVVVLVMLLLGFALMFLDVYSWRLWPAICRARRGIREIVRQRIPHAEVYSSQGATAISSGYLGFCIRTKTDKERDVLRGDPTILRQFQDALVRAGYPQNTNPVDPVVHFTIESQETVDRDYGGSWYEAMQMP